MSAENPTLEDFGFDSRELMIGVQRETMGKLIKAEARLNGLRAALEKISTAYVGDCHDIAYAALAHERDGNR